MSVDGLSAKRHEERPGRNGARISHERIDRSIDRAHNRGIAKCRKEMAKPHAHVGLFGPPPDLTKRPDRAGAAGIIPACSIAARAIFANAGAATTLP